jgi:hypothetical protein
LPSQDKEIRKDFSDFCYDIAPGRTTIFFRNPLRHCPPQDKAGAKKFFVGALLPGARWGAGGGDAKKAHSLELCAFLCCALYAATASAAFLLRVRFGFGASGVASTTGASGCTSTGASAFGATGVRPVMRVSTPAASAT